MEMIRNIKEIPSLVSMLVIKYICQSRKTLGLNKAQKRKTLMYGILLLRLKTELKHHK